MNKIRYRQIINLKFYIYKYLYYRPLGWSPPIFSLETMIIFCYTIDKIISKVDMVRVCTTCTASWNQKALRIMEGKKGVNFDNQMLSACHWLLRILQNALPFWFHHDLQNRRIPIPKQKRILWKVKHFSLLNLIIVR